MTMGHLQRILLLSLTTLSLIGSLQAISFNQKSSLHPLSQRILEYTRPQAAIPFNTDVKNGTAVKVEFGSEYMAANKLKENPSMLLEISSIETALCSINDTLFTQYQCPNASCFQNSSVSFQSPELFGHFKGYAGNASVQILDSSWALQTQAYFISDYNHTATYLTGANETYGWIGLAASAANNFPAGNPLFSIYIDDVNSGAGWILFDAYSEWTNSSSLLATISTGPQWQVNGVQFTLDGQSGPYESATAIFDLQYGRNDNSSIVLPTESFDFLIQQFILMPDMTCTSENCTYVGDIKDLPSIQFKEMVIPATVYMTEHGNGTYVSNFNRSSTNWNTRGSVTVFGWKVMSQYYFVFESTSNHSSSNISLYARPDGTSPSKGSSIDNPNTSGDSDVDVDGSIIDPSPESTPDSDVTGGVSDTQGPTGDSFFKSTGFYLLLIVLSMLIVGMITYFVNKRRAMSRAEINAEVPFNSVSLTALHAKNGNDSAVEEEIRKGFVL